MNEVTRDGRRRFMRFATTAVGMLSATNGALADGNDDNDARDDEHSVSFTPIRVPAGTGKRVAGGGGLSIVVWDDAPAEQSCTYVTRVADGSYRARRTVDNAPLPVLRIAPGNPANLQ